MTTQKTAIELAIEALITAKDDYLSNAVLKAIIDPHTANSLSFRATKMAEAHEALRAAQKVDVKALRLKIKVACMDDDGDIAPRDENDKNYLRGIDDAVNYLYVNNYLAATGYLSAIPEGYALVPLEPTTEMKLQGARSIGQTMSYPNHNERSLHCYRAMIAAAQEEK